MPPPDAIDPGTPLPDDADGPERSTGRPETPREWVHPSERAMQHRADEDRLRRRRVPALAIVGLGTVVVAVGIALGWGWVPASDQDESVSDTPSDVVPLVVVSASGTSTRSGVVVGPEGLIVTRAQDVQPPSEVYVLAAGRDPLRAQLTATDPALGIAVLDPRAEVGRPTEPAERPAIGDTVVVYRTAGVERRPFRTTASVSATDVDERLADGTFRRRLVLLRPAAGSDADESPEVDDGIVYDSVGRFVGVVVSQRVGSGELVVAAGRALEPSASSRGAASGDGPNELPAQLASTTTPGG